jgi:hypothetical protein
VDNETVSIVPGKHPDPEKNPDPELPDRVLFLDGNSLTPEELVQLGDGGFKIRAQCYKTFHFRNLRLLVIS